MIIGSDSNAVVDTLDLSHVDVLVEDFLLDKVDSPDADTVVVDSDEFLVGVVEESDLVGNVHANSVSDNSFSRFNLNLNWTLESVIECQLSRCNCL